MTDYHMHTTYSDGENSPEEMISAAVSMGLKRIAITDHVWKSSDWTEEYVNEILRLRTKYKRRIEIMIGFEAKAINIDGLIDASEYMISKSHFKMGCIHRIPTSNEEYIFLSRDQIMENKTEAYNNWLVTTLNMLMNENVDMIGHPFLALFKYEIIPKQSDIKRIFNVAVKYNKSLEFSSRYCYTNQYYSKLLEDKPFFLNYIKYGSDSHSASELIQASNHNLV